MKLRQNYITIGPTILIVINRFKQVPKYELGYISGGGGLIIRGMWGVLLPKISDIAWKSVS